MKTIRIHDEEVPTDMVRYISNITSKFDDGIMYATFSVFVEKKNKSFVECPIYEEYGIDAMRKLFEKRDEFLEKCNNIECLI
jgi:hypothetical protein